MYKSLTPWSAAVALSLLVSPTYAGLVDRSAGLIYDEDLNITWLQDANVLASRRGGLVTWGEASGWAADFIYFDSVRNVELDDWRLPSSPEELRHLYMVGLGGQIGYDLRYSHGSNYDLFENIQPAQYWTSMPLAVNPNNYMQTFGFYLGTEYSRDRNNEFAHVWLVRDGDVMHAVPEPKGYLLALTALGLLGLSTWRRKHV